MKSNKIYGIINKNTAVITNTVTEEELAILSVRSYPRAEPNRINLPEGWVELEASNNNGSYGFSYGVYRKGTNIEPKGQHHIIFSI